jgi:F-type H+-transporting ATPase subunit gamma
MARRLASLSDIAGIMQAMKGVASMETRVLAELLQNQQALVAGLEGVAQGFLAQYPEQALDAARGVGTGSGGVCVLLGSEQGFCGNFNELLLPQLVDQPAQWVLVGRKLAEGVAARALHPPPAVLAETVGALVATEVPAVLQRLSHTLSALLAKIALPDCRVRVVFHCDASQRIESRQVLPMAVNGGVRPAGATCASAQPLELNVPPADFWQALGSQYLYAALHEAMYSSLLWENRQRQAHMERALQRLDDDRERLQLRLNVARQEDITQEIEVLLLSAEPQ